MWKTCIWCAKPVKYSKRNCTIYILWKIYRNQTYGERFEAFSSRIKHIMISLAVVVLSFWRHDYCYLFPNSSMVERMTVNHEVPSSSLGWGAILLCRTGWFRISEISVVTRIKWFLECTKAATVEIRYNRKHIGFIPNLTFKGDCWRIWLGRCLGQALY